MRYRVPVMLGVLSLALTMLAPVALAQDSADIPRTPDGRPDLSGSYDIATLTPLQRSAEFGDKLVLTEEEAAAIEAGERAALASIFDADPAVNLEVSDPNRGAPPVGGDGVERPRRERRRLQHVLARPRQRGVPDRWAVAHVDHHRSAERAGGRP